MADKNTGPDALQIAGASPSPGNTPGSTPPIKDPLKAASDAVMAVNAGLPQDTPALNNTGGRSILRPKPGQ